MDVVPDQLAAKAGENPGYRNPDLAGTDDADGAAAQIESEQTIE